MDENETFERPYKEEELLEFVREGRTGGKGTWLGRRLLPVRARYHMQRLQEGTIDLETALLELDRLASDMDLPEVR